MTWLSPKLLSAAVLARSARRLARSSTTLTGASRKSALIWISGQARKPKEPRSQESQGSTRSQMAKQTKGSQVIQGNQGVLGSQGSQASPSSQESKGSMVCLGFNWCKKISSSVDVNDKYGLRRTDGPTTGNSRIAIGMARGIPIGRHGNFEGKASLSPQE